MSNYKELIAKSKFYKAITDKSYSDDKIIKLNIGAGPNIFPYNGWINYDRELFTEYFSWLKSTDSLVPKDSWQTDGPGSLENLQKLQKFLLSNSIDYKIHDLRKPFLQHDNNSVDLIYVGQVIEHLNPIHEVSKFLNECFRMMKPGAVIRLTTPDFDLLLKSYLENKMDSFSKDQPVFYKDHDPMSQLAFIMFGATGPKCTFDNYEGHMFMFTKTSMTSALKNAGFKDIEFYSTLGKSKNDCIQKEVIDAGISHSFIVEACK